MKLSIVIPALNEEQAIGATIERSLAAREHITRNSPVEEVELIVVSDGSTDRTVEIAAGYEDLQLIVFERNRGYGAAIKKGFEVSTGDLVAFLDADGTCDPRFFAELCRALVDEGAAVAIGSRLGPQSKMPKLRRIGNRIYALILSALSNRVVTDTASGMRVIRRDALQRLYPLPDGLNFTPAMSARVLMDERLRIVERPMAYEERIGDSKLHVVRDGLRFLRTIFEMTLMWRPAKLFAVGAGLCLTIMALLAMHPLESWLQAGRFDEDRIYRLLFCSFLGTVAMTMMSAGVVANHVQRMLAGSPAPGSFLWSVLDRIYSARAVAVASALSLPLLAWLIGEGLWTRLTEGHVYQHWSRAVLAGLVAFGLVQLFVTVLVVNVLRFHTLRAIAAKERSTNAVAYETVTKDRRSGHRPDAQTRRSGHRPDAYSARSVPRP